MPKLSAFTRFGMLAFSSRPSHGEAIYRALIANYGDAFDFTPGNTQEAKVYAAAMMSARTQYTLEAAVNEKSPKKATQMLSSLEVDYGVIPAPNANLFERRQAVATKTLLNRGARRESVEDALRTALGSDFLSYVTQPDTGSTSLPADPSTVGNYARPELPHKFLRFAQSVGITGVPVTFAYSSPHGDDRLQTGDRVILESENEGLAETVTIVATPGDLRATATLVRGHGLGASIRAGSFPLQTSNRRNAMIVLAGIASADPQKRRVVHEIMRRVARSVSNWVIVGPSGSGVAGPFLLGVSLFSRTPLTLTNF